MIKRRDCPASCKCVCYSLAEYMKNNGIPAPDESGLDNIILGEDGMTNNTRNIRCALLLNNWMNFEDIDHRTTWLLN